MPTWNSSESTSTKCTGATRPLHLDSHKQIDEDEGMRVRPVM
jgi:hypothetical protein